MSRGKYDESIGMLNKSVEKYKTKWRYKNNALYNIANCYHRKGSFEESIGWLNKMNKEKFDKNLKGSYYGLYAMNLIMLERDIEQAEEYMEIAISNVTLSCNTLIQSYLELLKGNNRKADEYIQHYFYIKKSKRFVFGFFTILFIDRTFEKVMNNYFMGFYYMKKKQYEAAKKHLSEASRCKYENYYSEISKKLLNNIK